MKEIVILKDSSGIPDSDWIFGLERELEIEGASVSTIEIDRAEILKSRIEKIDSRVGNPNNTIFVVLGNATESALKYVETLTSPIGGMVCMASWFNLENYPVEDQEGINVPWKEVMDIDKISKIVRNSFFIIKGLDPYRAEESNRNAFEKLQAEAYTVFSDTDFEEYPGTIEPIVDVVTSLLTNNGLENM